MKSHQQIMVYNTLLQYLGGHDQLYAHTYMDMLIYHDKKDEPWSDVLIIIPVQGEAQKLENKMLGT